MINSKFNEIFKRKTEIEPERGFGKLAYRITLIRWFFNFGWAWVVGFILMWINTITVVYYLIPAVKASMSFKFFAIYGFIALTILSIFLGWLLIKVFKVQSIETKMGTDVNPYSHTWLTRKELAIWRLFLSIAEQVKELSKQHELLPKNKKELFEKRIEKVREYLTNSKRHELDLLGKREGLRDIENLI